MGVFGIIAKVLPFALQVVPFVERLIGAGRGDEKRSAAVMLIVPLVTALEGIMGKEIVDEEALEDVVGQLVDAIVAMMNLFGILKGGDTPSD